MVGEDFFLKSWNFVHVDSTCTTIYPETTSLVIGRDPNPSLPGTYMAVWVDTAGNLHAFRQLHLNSGKLVNPRAVELGQPAVWNVTIEQDPVETEKLKGTILKADEIIEASLAGTWGAEAPPPLTGDDGGVPGLQQVPIGEMPAASSMNGAAG